jgi:hypothetical protein
VPSRAKIAVARAGALYVDATGQIISSQVSVVAKTTGD